MIYFAWILFLFIAALPTQAEKTRLIIMADMGNEPDEEQQMLHMLMYANMFDLEGLIAVSGQHLQAGKPGMKGSLHPDLFVKLIDGYEKVLGNLKTHAQGWPEPDYLRSIVKPGTIEYGITAVGKGKSTPGSNLIKDAILKADPRKLYFVGNAGTNTLAQALVDLEETRSPAEVKSLTQKLIVFENGAQDNAGAWIMGKFPDIAWHRSNNQTYSYGGDGKGIEVEGPFTWEPYARTAVGQHDWADEHVVKNHGALGALYPSRLSNPDKYIEGGGTIPWMNLALHGLSHPEHLYWGGWSGRFSRIRQKNVYSKYGSIRRDEQKYPDFMMFQSDSESEKWTDPVHKDVFESFQVPVWRFRRAMWNDFRARMDWCVKPFAQANHNPIAAVNGDAADTIIHVQALPGQEMDFDASASKDPDGDKLIFHWWVYQEAGTYKNPLSVPQAQNPSTRLLIPKDALGKEIHLILEVRDENPIIPLYDYRRIIINVVDKVTALNRTAPQNESGFQVTFPRRGAQVFTNSGKKPFTVSLQGLTGKTEMTFSLGASQSHTADLKSGLYAVRVTGGSPGMNRVLAVP